MAEESGWALFSGVPGGKNPERSNFAFHFALYYTFLNIDISNDLTLIKSRTPDM